ncbi:glycosyltransferase family 9 protein [Alphaproteobacteria bacterium]|nr:glycosyltransferase family 9 protein [Alphaproteobacteria bacterium]
MTTQKAILVIKHGALGDLIQGFDAYASVRAGFPDAHIALLTTPAFASLARKMPWFDDIIIDQRASFFNLAATARILYQLRRKWHAIIDMQCSNRTAHYHRFFATSSNDWYGTATGCSHPMPDFTGVNNQQRMLTAARMAGGINADADMAWLKADISHFQLPDRFAVLIVGCSPTKPSKRWPSEHFASLACTLMAEGYAVVLAGTVADRKAVDAVRDNAPDAIDLAGKTDIPMLAALCNQASLVVGNDTGPAFLAAKTGTPTLMLFGVDTNPDMSAPVGENSSWLQKLPISDITPDMVMERLTSMKAL